MRSNRRGFYSGVGCRGWDVGRPCNKDRLLALASPTTPTPALPKGREYSFSAAEPWRHDAAWAPIVGFAGAWDVGGGE